MSSLSFGDRIVRSAWRAAPQRTLSTVIGWGSKRRLPRALRRSVLARFAAIYGIDVGEAERDLPDYESLQDFFTRRLRAGLRPIDAAADSVVAPSDGVVCDTGLVTQGKLLEAKGAAFTLADLLADPDLASRLNGGSFLVTYLSPRDYHRVHSPVAGRVTSWTHIPGKLFPVGSGSVAREPGLFARNERFVTVIEGPAGLTALVMVAAVGVGHITASYDSEVATHSKGFGAAGVRRKCLPEPIAIERGGELGIFNLGSTTIAVFQPGRVALNSLPCDVPLRMGERVGHITALGTDKAT